ncbi:MAG: PA2928 family protein [Chthoniobacterales bacterium]
MDLRTWRGFFLLGGLVMLTSCESGKFGPPQRIGPPLFLMQENEPRLWFLVKIEERRQRRLGGGRYLIGKWITETHYHFDLHGHDARTTERLWTKRLLSVKDKEGGHNAQGRILGRDGEVVWLFLRNQPIALAARDGSVLADGQALEQGNPALQGVLPKELGFYAFDEGLIVTSADGRRSRVRAPGFAAEPYAPSSDEHFRRVQFMATQWGGGYNTKDFLVRQARLGGRWLGLYTEKEAADAGDDEFGDSLANPSSVFNEGSRARRTFWSARIGKTKEFTEGTHDRLFEVTKVPGAPEFLEAGLLIKQGTQTPLTLENPAGVLVLHRTRLDAEGRLALTRLDESLAEQWKAPLPIVELRNRFELPDRLLIYGALDVTEKSTRSWQELIVAVDLRDGKTQAWNLTLERPAP